MGRVSPETIFENAILQARDKWFELFGMEISKGLLPCLHFKNMYGTRKQI
jgi:hypothetical protein